MFGDPEARERIERLLMVYSLEELLDHFGLNEVDVLNALWNEGILDLFDEELG